MKYGPNAKDASEVSAERPGFTLVEIAIVMAIIGVLAGVGGSRYARYLERARVASAIIELRGIAAELQNVEEFDEFPGSLAEAGISTRDPWGNPYQYLLLEGQLPPGIASVSGELPHVGAPAEGGGKPAIAQARKDRFLVPINSDFDLYSIGPDGETMPTLNHPTSRDDIIRAASGAFYGPAENF